MKVTTSPSAPDLLTQGLVEELYRRRSVIGLIAVMALTLTATAIGLQVWAPAASNEAGPGLAESQLAPVSAPGADQAVRIETPELWITPYSASGARVWVRSDSASTSSTAAGR